MGGVRDGRRPNQEGREGNGSGFCFDDGLVRLPPGSDIGNPNALGEIFQVSFFVACINQNHHLAVFKVLASLSITLKSCDN